MTSPSEAAGMEDDLKRRLEGFDAEQVLKNLQKYLTDNWRNATINDFKYKVLT